MSPALTFTMMLLHPAILASLSLCTMFLYIGLFHMSDASKNNAQKALWIPSVFVTILLILYGLLYGWTTAILLPCFIGMIMVIADKTITGKPSNVEEVPEKEEEEGPKVPTMTADMIEDAEFSDALDATLNENMH